VVTGTDSPSTRRELIELIRANLAPWMDAERIEISRDMRRSELLGMLNCAWVVNQLLSERRHGAATDEMDVHSAAWIHDREQVQ